MKARYATVCAACGVRIAPGEEIISTNGGKSGGWVHVGCQTTGLFDPGPGTATTAPSASRTAPTRSVPAKARRVEAPLAAGTTAVYTDGACSGNPGPGGWAWAVADGRQGSGGDPATTNQRMEIRAALEAVRAISDSPLAVVSDSTYVVNCFRDEWWKGWLARGWRNSQKQPVANRDLWEPLVDLVQQRGDVTFRWVKGHSNDPMNDLVDRLAVEAGRLIRLDPR